MNLVNYRLFLTLCLNQGKRRKRQRSYFTFLGNLIWYRKRGWEYSIFCLIKLPQFLLLSSWRYLRKIFYFFWEWVTNIILLSSLIVKSIPYTGEHIFSEDTSTNKYYKIEYMINISKKIYINRMSDYILSCVPNNLTIMFYICYRLK